jgi:protein-disulfide isomerase
MVMKGKVQMLFHDFPLPQHKFAKEAAYYAVAAGKIGKRELVTDALFRTQLAWSADGKIEPVVSSVLTPADFTKVKALSKDAKVQAEVNADQALGQKLNISQTPTMIISSKGKTYPVSGVVTFTILKQFIDSLLQ